MKFIASIVSKTKTSILFVQANENETDDEDYLVDHSIVMYLVSPDGEFLDFFTQRMEVRDIVERIGKHAGEYNNKKKQETSQDIKK